jgi:hypothetical protein
MSSQSSQPLNTAQTVMKTIDSKECSLFFSTRGSTIPEKWSNKFFDTFLHNNEKE